MRLTKKKAIELHRELWDWLAKNPGKEKIHWPRLKRNGGDICTDSYLCFPCSYVNQRDRRVLSNCILEFSYREDVSCSTYECLGGLYRSWNRARSKPSHTKYAELIRDLPERKRR